MGLGDKLSKLFKGEESRSDEGIKVNSGEKAAEMKGVEMIQNKNEMVEGDENPSQAEGILSESSASNIPVTKERVLEVMSDIYDPEIPVDIVNLGLIYDVNVEDGKVHVKMTLTS